jgi:uncharacterized protein (TIGR03437 family)
MPVDKTKGYDSVALLEVTGIMLYWRERCRGGRLSAIVALLVSLSVAVGADLSIPVQPAGPGGSVVISAIFTPGSDPIAALQFDLQYDGTAMSFISVPGAAARNSSKTAYYEDLDPNTRRFVVSGINQNPIPGGSAMDLFVNLFPGASSGLHALAIANFVATDVSGNVVSTTTTSGAVNVQSTAAGAPMESSGVVNAASFISGPVAPGEIITLIGSGIGPAIAQQPASSVTSTALGGVTVLFDGIMAPLLYAGPNQINAIVPFEISGESVTNVLVEDAGHLIAGLPLFVAGAAPAIFTLDASGAGAGAVLNYDLTLNSPTNPAARGSTVVLYGTGAGSMNPQPADGQLTSVLSYPNAPVAVTIGGQAADVQYFGVAPGEVAGLIQINCVVPQGIAPGDAVSVNLTVGTATSPPGVIIAVR